MSHPEGTTLCVLTLSKILRLLHLHFICLAMTGITKVCGSPAEPKCGSATEPTLILNVIVSMLLALRLE